MLFVVGSMVSVLWKLMGVGSILLWLNPGVRDNHLISQPSWIAAWLSVTCVCPLYLVDQLILMFCTPVSLPWWGRWWFLWHFSTHGEYGLSPMASWCCSGGWIWNSSTKLCCIPSWKWNTSRVSLEKLDIRYVMF